MRECLLRRRPRSCQEVGAVDGISAVTVFCCDGVGRFWLSYCLGLSQSWLRLYKYGRTSPPTQPHKQISFLSMTIEKDDRVESCQQLLLLYDRPLWLAEAHGIIKKL
jgi:hypothetical protein